MKKELNLIKAFLLDNDIKFSDHSETIGASLLIGSFDLTNEQLRKLINNVVKNNFTISFEKTKFFITDNQ